MPETSSVVDIVGVGLNATDTVIRLPHFPAFNSKVEFRVSEVLPGGQVATRRHGLRAMGLEDALRRKDRRRFCRASFSKTRCESAGIEAHWIVVPDCQSQSSFILVDEATGERTVLWKRDPRLELLPSEIEREWVVQARLLHVDGHDCAGATEAARWARSAQHSRDRRPRQPLPRSGSFT